jgi:hypothetical protein
MSSTVVDPEPDPGDPYLIRWPLGSLLFIKDSKEFHKKFNIL